MKFIISVVDNQHVLMKQVLLFDVNICENNRIITFLSFETQKKNSAITIFIISYQYLYLLVQMLRYL